MKPTAVPITVLDPRRDEDWPRDTSPGIRRYLTDLVLEGPEVLVTNAKGVSATILRVGSTIVPLLVSDGRPGKASMLSPIGHHVLYPIDEIAKQNGRLWRPALHLVLAPLLAAFRVGGLDKVAYLNHWLMTGAPPLSFDAPTWAALLRFVAERHPHHAVLVPDIVPDVEPALYAGLDAAGAQAVPWRTVAIFDPDNPTAAHSRRTLRDHWQRGRSMLRRAEPRQVGAATARAQVPRLLALYSDVYRARHNNLNPGYTARFFAGTVSEWHFDFAGWTDAQGAIEAFQLAWWHRDRLLWASFGVDLAQAREKKLYPLCMAYLIEEALLHRRVLNWGAGALAFKIYRGARTFQQVEFLDCRHLPWYRRALWTILRRFRVWRSRHRAAPP
jgi:hypothetical protein